MLEDNQSAWRPTARWDVLERRARLLQTVRRFFEEAGYWEVETPILSRDIVVDAHLDPFVTHFVSGRLPDTIPTGGPALFLQTSPEFAMKRLLAAGAKAIYQIARVMRNGESGPWHNPEFTLIEWYRVGDDHHDQMQFTELLVRRVFGAAVPCNHRPALSENPFERLTYDAAFERHAGCKVLDLQTAELIGLAKRQGLVPPPGLSEEDRDGWLNFLLAMLVEPKLGQDHPTFLYDYPATQAALARIRPGHPPVAERFELYVRGMEVCNGYHELTEADELRRRMTRQNALRTAEGACRLPETNRLLEAMLAGLPACAGVALGWDRLVLLALGLSTIDEVIAFPFRRA